MIRVMIAGMGNMGISHALACHESPDFRIVGLVNRSIPDLPDSLRDYPLSHDYAEALARLKPDLVVIATYSDSHADFAVAAMRAGAHVFVEKPLATNVADARRGVDCAAATGRKLVVGYILRHHPGWQRLIAEARALGGPFVFRLNLNQQSSGPSWAVHKALMRTTSPIVDCGVHYVDVMCQITDAAPVEVRGMGLRLSDEIAPDMYNYGHFQVLFADEIATHLVSFDIGVDDLTAREVLHRQAAHVVGHVCHHGSAEHRKILDCGIFVQHAAVAFDRVHDLPAVMELRHFVAFGASI